MKSFKLSIVATLVANSFANVAIAETDLPDVVLFEPVVVTATKTDKNITEVPQMISVATDEDIKQQQATDISETLNRMAGVKATGGTYGEFSIRGGSSGQVILNIDGVNQSVDSNKGMTINPLNIAPFLVKQVEVLKGGGSTLYGSGGMSGTVVIKTKSVEDLLGSGDNNNGGFVRTRYDSSNESFNNGIGVYGRTDDASFDYLITADGYNSELEKDNQEQKTKDESRNISGKFGISVDEYQRLQLNIKHSERKYSDYVVAPDDYDNDTIQLTHNLYRGDNINLESNVSYTKIKRKAAMTNAMAGLQYSELTRLQFDTKNTHYLELDSVTNEITYGLNILNSEQKGWVNGEVDNFANANGQRKEYGAFVQDTLTWGMLTSTAALRYVNYNMSGTNSSSVKTKKVLPSLGLTVDLTNWLALYANYNRGFRAPSIDEMYTEIHYPEFNMAVVPNPDLKPENSVNREVGFGLHDSGIFADGDRGSVRFTYFNQNIDDMIEASPEPTVNPETGRIEYTTINVAKANRNGMELELRYGLDNLMFSASTDYLHTKDKNSGVKRKYARNLDTAITYNLPEFGVTATWLTNSSSSSDVSGTKTSGYTVQGLRVQASYDDLELSAGVRNLFDTEYKTERGIKGEERTYIVGAAYNF